MSCINLTNKKLPTSVRADGDGRKEKAWKQVPLGSIFFSL